MSINIKELASNPIVLALIIAVIRNLSGYIAEKLRTSTEKYDSKKLLETLAIYEGIIIAMSAVPGMPAYLAVVIAVAVDLVRGIKKAIEEANAARTQT